MKSGLILSFQDISLIIVATASLILSSLIP